MTEEEAALFVAFIRKCRFYVEFGAGGSTVVASGHADTILSVDSSKEWLDRIDQSCANSKTEPKLMLIDIGPTGEWGFPNDPSTKDRWPKYHSEVWKTTNSAEGTFISSMAVSELRVLPRSSCTASRMQSSACTTSHLGRLTTA
jgi:hypothetical protein